MSRPPESGSGEPVPAPTHETWKQERPAWCPHTDCQFRRRAQDAICGGQLPNPEPHDGDWNTHRVCINADGVFDLQVNGTDLEWWRWIMDALDGKATSWLSKRAALRVRGPDAPTSSAHFELAEKTPPNPEEGEPSREPTLEAIDPSVTPEMVAAAYGCLHGFDHTAPPHDRAKVREALEAALRVGPRPTLEEVVRATLLEWWPVAPDPSEREIAHVVRSVRARLSSPEAPREPKSTWPRETFVQETPPLRGRLHE